MAHRAPAVVAGLAVLGLTVSVAGAAEGWPGGEGEFRRAAPVAVPLRVAPPAAAPGPTALSAEKRAAAVATERARTTSLWPDSAVPMLTARAAGVETVRRSGRSAVTQVRMPVVGMDAPVRRVGVARDGQMALPPNPDVVGWYRYGPSPGEDAGSVVLAGHVDTYEHGLGQLARLRDVVRGDLVVVTTADDKRHRYVVVRKQRFEKQALPGWVFGRGGDERLHMITCVGDYDAEEGGYDQNLVVTARPA